MSDNPTTTWDAPTEVSDVEIAFPATVTGKLLPPRELLTEDMWAGRHPYAQLANDWFGRGLSEALFAWKPGIDQDKALRHLRAVLRSWEPKHEHKLAGVAYLLTRWCEAALQRHADGTATLTTTLSREQLTPEQLTELLDNAHGDDHPTTP